MIKSKDEKRGGLQCILICALHSIQKVHIEKCTFHMNISSQTKGLSIPRLHLGPVRQRGKQGRTGTESLTSLPGCEAVQLYQSVGEWKWLIWLKALHFSRLCLGVPPPPLPSPQSPPRLTAGIYFKSLCPLPGKLSDRPFCGPHKSISSCYRSKKYLFCPGFVSCGQVERHQSRNTPGDKWSFYFQKKYLHSSKGFLHFTSTNCVCNQINSWRLDIVDATVQLLPAAVIFKVTQR